MKTRSHCSAPIPKQEGAVLFVALIFLVLLTLLGLTASSTSILEERMTSNTRNAQLAWYGAESAIRAGEVDIWTVADRSGGTAALPPCGSGGSSTAQQCVYTRINGIQDSRVGAFRTTPSVWLAEGSDGANQYTATVSGQTGAAASGTLNSQPRYLIEDLGPARLAGSQQGYNSGPGGRAGQVGATNMPEMHLYRVTARSQGATDTSLRVVESVYGAYSPNNQFN
ncbi:PilX N-terminal domain-containing pilus assembly protein [Rudaea sp.]|uniref:pilus assembly PilX family protein n=1 Tax=Rudaea sp. TaxID=2136325 RepID=UPI00322024F4